MEDGREVADGHRVELGPAEEDQGQAAGVFLADAASASGSKHWMVAPPWPAPRSR